MTTAQIQSIFDTNNVEGIVQANNAVTVNGVLAYEVWVMEPEIGYIVCVKHPSLCNVDDLANGLVQDVFQATYTMFTSHQ